MEEVPASTGEFPAAVGAVPSFVRVTYPRRVVFGGGSITRLADEVAALGCERVAVVSGGAALPVGRRVAGLLGGRCVTLIDEIRQHVPAELAAAAVDETKRVGTDGLCSVGGGSATGLAKAVAVELDLPIVAVPTTYAGSEMTPIWGVTGQHKQTGRDPRAAPRVVVYDPEVTTTLSRRVTATSGLNALAHAVSVLLSGADPVASLHAAEAVRLLVATLPAVVAVPDDLPARTRLLYGAHLAATALEAGRLAGIHHPLCHIVAGTYRLTHAEVHAVLLPHTLAYVQAHHPGSVAAVIAALQAQDPAGRIHDLARRLGSPTSLAEIGMPAEGLEEAAERGAGRLGEDSGRLRQVLDDAYAGRPPRSKTEEQKGAAS